MVHKVCLCTAAVAIDAESDSVVELQVSNALADCYHSANTLVSRDLKLNEKSLEMMSKKNPFVVVLLNLLMGY